MTETITIKTEDFINLKNKATAAGAFVSENGLFIVDWIGQESLIIGGVILRPDTIMHPKEIMG